jgi:hypothetical protein
VTHAGLNFSTSAVSPPGSSITQACADIRGSLGAGFVNQGSFGNATRQSYASASAISAALQGIRLEEHPNGQWVLTIGKRPVASSDVDVDPDPWLKAQLNWPTPIPAIVDASSPLRDIWPECLKLPNYTVPANATTAGGPSTNGCSELGNYMGELFPVGPNTAIAADLLAHTAMRDRIEQTLFYMGALAGQIPAGVFSLPVPIANREASSLRSAPIPAPALYGPSYFQANGTDGADTLYTLTNDLGGGALAADKTLSPWGPDQQGAMQPARSFPETSPGALANIRSHTKGWLATTYNQLFTTGAYLYTQTDNAPMAFDANLVPGLDSSTRDSLAGWLTDRSTSYNNVNDTNFVGDVESATFLTTASQDSSADSPKQFKFCGDGGFAHGRSVCVHAPTSPVFFYTYDNWESGETCGPATFLAPAFDSNNLINTAIPRFRSRCVLPNQGILANNFCDPPGGGTIYQIVGDAWFTIDEATGSSDKQVPNWFAWDTKPTTCPGAGNNFTPVNNAGSAAIIDTGCETFTWGSQFFPAGESFGMWKDRLKPTMCPPEERVELFLNTDVGSGASARANAMGALVNALSVSCIAANQRVGASLANAPPAITGTNDIRQLESWVNQLGYDIDQIASALYLVDVPVDVVTLSQSGQSDVGAVTAGERGKLLLDLEQKLNLLENGFSTLGSTLQQISDAIKHARLELEAVQLQNNGQQLTIAASKIDNDRQRALALVSKSAAYAQIAAGAVTGVASVLGGVKPDFAGAARAAGEIVQAGFNIKAADIDIDAAQKMDDVLVGQATNANAMQENGEAQAVLSLATTTATLYQTVNDNITGLKNNDDAALQDIASLHQNSSQATLDLAKAAGADFMEQNGKQVPLHVNTVYRRQFDLTKQRYGLALEGAKRTAYLARLSIEQRLGVRLDELHQNIGPLEAPATWVDDLCSVQGVNYDKLREGSGQPSSSPGELDLIKGLANQFVGDYVDKLRQFVQFYNVQFPFANSNDVAVVSLREDLQSSLTQCNAASTNLLLYSDQLTAATPDLNAPGFTAHGGWRTTACAAAAGGDAGTSSSCVQVSAGSMLNNPGTGGSLLPVRPPNGEGGASLLSHVTYPPAPLTSPDGGAPSSPIAPTEAVFQTVTLKSATHYVLSWWDMARNPDGTPFTPGQNTTPAQYTAGVFDSNWSIVAGDSFTPQSQDGLTWSDRHTVDVIAPADGDYQVVFTAGPPGNMSSAVAIANVQLEVVADNAGGATNYVSNAGSLQHTTGKCPVDTPDQFRTRFKHVCDTLGCWFELGDTLAIDTQLLNQGSSSLVGKLAPGNFNYRNNTIAVNVVGTGVIDCSRAQDASCNGSAYVNYDLQHVAYNVPLDDYEGGIRCFDFGSGNIRGAKALAAERFITLPMSSSDKDMVSQSPFLKPEFSGRPLSGSYRLRILDEPQLVWENVNDVQIVMNYSYWSKVDRSPGN